MADAAETVQLEPEAVEQAVRGKVKKAKGFKAKGFKAKRGAPPADKNEAAAQDTNGQAPLGKHRAARKRAKLKKGEKKRPAGKRGCLPLILLLAALLTALLLVAFVVYSLDLFAWRSNLYQSAATALASLDPDYRPYIERLAEQESALNARELELQQREEAVAADGNLLDKRAAALDARERRLNERQINPTPLFRREISEEKLMELKNLGKIYSGMETEAAAQALALLNRPMEMAEVLFYMDKNAAAALLSALEPELTAQITSEMLRE